MGEQAVSKEDLEKVKLGLEIRELQKSLLRRPAFYAVAGPTLLALCTLSLGWATGLFDVKSERIRNETVLLSIQKVKLRDDIDKLAADVEQKKKDVAKEKAEIERRLADETKRIAETLENERAQMKAELVPLQRQLASVKEQIAQKNRELDELPIQTLLDQMASTPALNAFDRASESLIETLKKKKDKVALLDARLKQNGAPLFKANVLYVIYEATKDAQRLRSLFNFLAKAEFDESSNPWTIIGTGRWEADDLPAVMKFVAENAGHLSKRSAGLALQIFQSPRLSPEMAKSKLAAIDRIALFKLGRKIALDRNEFEITRGYGILAAGYFVPNAFPILLGRILLDPGETPAVKEYLHRIIGRALDSMRIVARNLRRSIR